MCVCACVCSTCYKFVSVRCPAIIRPWPSNVSIRGTYLAKSRDYLSICQLTSGTIVIFSIIRPLVK